MKINDNTFCNLSHIIRNCFVSIGIVLCLILFPAIADKETNSENTDETVVEQVEEKTVEPNNTEDDEKVTEKEETKTDNEEIPANIKKEVITGTSDEMERDQKTGTTVLIGNAKTLRHNEDGKVIGFLNADRIIIKTDPDTGKTKEIIAVGNVEIRDKDIFATCDHAVMDNLTNIITLKDNVEVLQNNDRLESKLFTFNRTTGRQTGVGDVKFKVTITQTVPDESEDSDTDAEDKSAVTSEGDKETTPGSESGKEKDSDKTDKEENTASTEKPEDQKNSESEKEDDTESAETEETESAEENEEATSEETKESEESEESEEAELDESEEAEEDKETPAEK